MQLIGIKNERLGSPLTSFVECNERIFK